MRTLTGTLLTLLLAVPPVLSIETSAQAQVTVVRTQLSPPAPRIEAIPRAPSPRHIWIAGHWGLNGPKFVWVPGHHTLPPHPGYHWHPAHWTNEGGGWVFTQGHWSAAYEAPVVPPSETNFVDSVPPPPPQEEVVPPSPGPGQIWTPGYHRWDPVAHRHVWVGGHYEVGRPGHHWVPTHWVRTHRGWELQQGHWRQ